MLNHVFTTPVLRETTALTPAQLEEISGHLLGLRANSVGEEKSNRGGWHSSGNLFAPEHRQFDFLREAVTRALFSYIGDAFGFRGELELALTGWAVINRPGDYNVPHNHASNLLSGALDSAVPEGMRGGEIVFQDPRLNLNAVQTDSMRRLNVQAPWYQTSISVAPAAGDILIFPSWLLHYVAPYQHSDPNALRIVVSFNAIL